MNGARLFAGGLALALIGSACTSDSPVVTPTDGGATQTSQPPQGGSAVFGAEVWPECLNPIIGCAAERWTHYTVLQHVLPRAMELDPQGNYVASPLLDQAPSLTNGGLDPGPPFRITFRIRPEAAWNDGTAITSEDFAFTWSAIMSTGGSIGRETHDRIEAIDTSDPKTAVITLDDTWAGWPELFGGTRGYLLKRSAFPGLSASDSPDLNNQLLDSIPFSGGPFRLTFWDDSRAVLVRNPNYFGPSANLARVTFIPLLDVAFGIQALIKGGVDVIAPSADGYANCCPGSPLDVAPEIFGARGGEGAYLEALWFNAHERPLSDHLVREALMYAIDRQGVVDEFVRRFNPSAQVVDCGFVASPVGPWCRTRPFERFTYDPSRALSLLEESGYYCTTLPCTKNGKPLEVRYHSNSISVLSTTPQEILIGRAMAAGFDLKVVSYEGEGGGVGFGTHCPWSTPISGCAVPIAADPSVTKLLACDRIPTEENRFVGENVIGWCNLEATRLMHESDRELDPARRLQLISRVHEIQAEERIGLPLYVHPVASVWRVDNIAGPIGLYNSTPYGVFFNMNEWYVPR